MLASIFNDVIGPVMVDIVRQLRRSIALIPSKPEDRETIYET